MWSLVVDDFMDMQTMLLYLNDQIWREIDACPPPARNRDERLSE
jgi:hypothetical protein